jgi:polyisoprenoid-binding protein YceI
MRAWLIAGLLLISPAAAAQDPTAPTFQVAVDQPDGEYRLDPRHASVQFRIRHMGLALSTARFDVKDATLTLDRDDPSRSTLTASVDATSVNTGVLNRDGERAFDADISRALGGGPITFASTAIERTGETTARVTGDLSMNGQTHPASFDVTFAGSANDILRGGKRVLGFSGVGTITRSDWGVRDWRAFTADEVEIVIEAEFVKA